MKHNVKIPLEKIGLPHSAYEIAWVREPSDWLPCEPGSFVHHMPTKTTFEFCPLPHKDMAERMTLHDFEARLAHVWEGSPTLPQSELDVLCQKPC